MAVVAARQLMSPAFRRRTPLRRHRSRLAAVSAPIIALLAGVTLAAVIGLGSTACTVILPSLGTARGGGLGGRGL